MLLQRGSGWGRTGTTFYRLVTTDCLPCLPSASLLLPSVTRSTFRLLVFYRGRYLVVLHSAFVILRSNLSLMRKGAGAKLLPKSDCLSYVIAGCFVPAILDYHLSCFISQEMCYGCVVRFLFDTICKSGNFSIRRPRFTLCQICWRSDTNSPLVAFRFVLIFDWAL